MQNGNDILSYSYDEVGNIQTITENGELKATYYYDELSQLIREDNGYLNKTITYEYDAGGNIQSVTEYAYTTGELGEATQEKTYGYEDANWKDKLTNYNGQTITYDEIGNPIHYLNGLELAWENGRQLSGGGTGAAGGSFTYEYNDEGLRIKKRAGGYGATDYYYNADQLLTEINDDYRLDYLYDEHGDLLGFTKNGQTYYYIMNMSRDIIGILDKDGNKVVSYVYDSWGKTISTTGPLADTIGARNPFRYAGYYFDNETGLYYVQSRYYDPETHRFLNADDTNILRDEETEFTGYNLFAYSMNNPINLYDPNGNSADAKTLGSLLVMAMACGAIIGSVGGPLGALLGAVAVVGVAACVINRVLQIKVFIQATKLLRQIQQTRKKSNNLPSYKNININMDHIMSGHSPGGNRGGPGKDRFPGYLSRNAIRKAIITAYRYGKKLQTQRDRVLIRGPWGNNYIDMWVNTVTKTIESAWPKWK